ncbi:MAG TPA: zinc ribbon domain-containing protein [Planctomycetota bacterium]|nr:zinc ribbon domain-containing protein [Planctomycetota bacterium]
MKRRRTFTCPHCGADVAARSLACPECGSDAGTGWSEQPADWAGELPSGYGDDPDFDYEEALRSEGLSPGGTSSRASRRRRWVVAVGVLLIVCLLMWLVGR